MKNLAIIPARSGSKGIKNKNIIPLCGKPLMQYTISAALESGMFDEVMVSTDSEEYAGIARGCGAKVPFLRSRTNSQDKSNKWDAVAEVLDGYRKNGAEFDTFCVLQPTSPLRTAEDIISSYELFGRKDAVAVISVCPAEHSPAWCNVLGGEKRMDGFISKEADSQRQILPDYYRLNGAIYIMRVSEFETDRYPYREGSFAYVMPADRSVDIDGKIDLLMAELLINQKSQQG